ncbi:MAG: hypothetical protein AAF945_21450 [Actinomycetota bacterium]
MASVVAGSDVVEDDVVVGSRPLAGSSSVDPQAARSPAANAAAAHRRMLIGL